MERTRHICSLLAASALITLGGCYSAPVELEGRPSGSLTLPLKGVYKATVRAPFVGPISARFTAEPTEKGFIANSRPGVAWTMIGGFQGFLGQVFVPFLFPGGVILTWRSGLPDHGKPGEGWMQIGGIRTAGAKTRMTDPNAPIEVISPDGRRAAVLTLEPCPNTEGALDDYKELGAKVERAFRARLYDPALLDSGSVRAYLNQLRYSSSVARDDLEFIFGEAIAARNNLKLPMPIAVRRADESSRRLGVDAEELLTVHATRDAKTDLATIKVEAFFEGEDVDKAFKQVVGWHAKGLILDLRSCPGVTLASLRAACWLVDHPTDAGFYFAAAHRADALAGKLDSFPRAEFTAVASIRATESLLDEQGSAAVVIMPESDHFTGPVAVLISRRTTTSAEPLARVLKDTGRARLFGVTTVGRPMLSRPTDLGDGWDLWVSAFDYLPPSGEHLDGKGVEPDVEASSKEQTQRAAAAWLLSEIGAASHASAVSP